MGHAMISTRVMIPPPLRLNLNARPSVFSSASSAALSAWLMSTSFILSLIIAQSNLVLLARLPRPAMAPPVSMPAMLPKSIE